MHDNLTVRDKQLRIVANLLSRQVVANSILCLCSRDCIKMRSIGRLDEIDLSHDVVVAIDKEAFLLQIGDISLSQSDFVNSRTIGNRCTTVAVQITLVALERFLRATIDSLELPPSVRV